MSLLLSGGTVRPITVTARQDLSETEKEKARHRRAVQNVLLGGQVAVCGGAGGRIPRGFLSNVSAAGQRGDMVSGMACLGRIHQRPIDLSKLAKELPLLPHICQVYFSKKSS